MAATKKCLIWDLDNTLWDGVCLEGAVRLRPEVADTIVTLDRRGILHSVASRGDADVALGQLRAFALDDYFLAPKVNWLPKPTNILAIGRELGIALDAMAFVDDEPFELAQVRAMLPGVTPVHARHAGALPDAPEFTTSSETRECRTRRQFYRAEHDRRTAEGRYATRADFLRACAMHLSVRPMAVADVPRVAELMTRTHQLNTTGLVYAPEQIQRLAEADDRAEVVTVADLTDRFGDYGTIGVGIARREPSAWTLTYLALSCRVLGRGIERAFLAALLRDAARCGYAEATALLRPTGRNRQMRVLYHMAGFVADRTDSAETATAFRMRLDTVPDGPDWIALA